MFIEKNLKLYIMKNLKNLGKALNKNEQKVIIGGSIYDTQHSCESAGGEWKCGILGCSCINVGPSTGPYHPNGTPIYK